MYKKLLILILLSPTFAFASQTGGGVLPYESWLMSIQESLTGPLAFSIALIGIVTCGATLILSGGEIGTFMRTFIYIVLVMTLLIGANNLMQRFFNGSLITKDSIVTNSTNAMTNTDNRVDLLNQEILLN